MALALSVFVAAKPVHASGTIQKSVLWCSHEINPDTCKYSTKEEACNALAATNPSYNYSPFVQYSGGSFMGYSCYGYYLGNLNNPQSLGWLITGIACPLNSTPTTTTTCTCNGTFVPASTGTSCVAPATTCPPNMSGSPCACNPGYSFYPYYSMGCYLTPAACPANMSGTPCACNSGYVPNPDGAGCVLDQYKLTLKSDAVQKVAPSNAASIIAMVEDAQGNGISGVRVSLSVDVDSTSGGHDHGGTNRDKGSPTGEACNPPKSNCAIVTTDPGGYAFFTFNAPAISGEHTYTAACISPTCSGTATGAINVKVDGLIQIPGSPLYAFIGANEKHRSNHYLTPEAATVLQDMAASYQYEFMFLQRKQFHFGRWGQFIYTPIKLHVNDASLIWGGKFDVNGNWGSPHAGHRRGVVIDVRANENTGAIPQASFTNFQDMAASYGAEAQVHCTSNKTDGQNRKPPFCVGNDGSQDSNRHMHILLLGVDQ